MILWWLPLYTYTFNSSVKATEFNNFYMYFILFSNYILEFKPEWRLLINT
jgi:hypothetical protein